ncbi:MAG: TetR/AcrR family transcriptional regulator [Solirubrobacteraceae bacterium]|jgi:AcrR family transcriptional regulator
MGTRTRADDLQAQAAEETPGEPIPPSIALAWGLRGRGARGPKPGLTLERIAQAGIDLADREGIDAVSMARLAAELGAGTMSLYRYVASKDELLTLMVDTGLGPACVPADVRAAGWRAALAWWARSVREAYGRHPWTLKVPITAPPLGPNNVDWMEAALEAMTTTPLSEPEKLSTLLLISGFVRNAATLTADLSAAQRADAPSPTYGTILSQLTDPKRFPAIHRAIASGTLDDDDKPSFDTDFDYGLERILDGVDALIRRRHRQARQVQDTTPEKSA